MVRRVIEIDREKCNGCGACADACQEGAIGMVDGKAVPEKVDTTETDVDILAANIRTKYLGVDYGTLNSVDHSFTDTDLYRYSSFAFR